MSLHLKLVTPERVIFQDDFDSISCPTTMGQITVLQNHVPLVATMVPGELIARKGDDEYFLHVAGGFLEIREGNSIIALADAAEHHYEIDVAAAEAAKAQAEQGMREQTLSDEEYAKVAASLERSLARITIARKHAHRRERPITSEGIFKE
jgi:F-type H+-transporting ATPase subunit epsilon